jgi:hypothetical protein
MTADEVTKALLSVAPYVQYEPYVFDDRSDPNWQVWSFGSEALGPAAYANFLYVRSDVEMDGVDWPCVISECRRAFDRGPSNGYAFLTEAVQVL